MTSDELTVWIDRLKENADSLMKTHADEGYLCETCLVHMKTVIRNLRYEKSQELKITE